MTEQEIPMNESEELNELVEPVSEVTPVPVRPPFWRRIFALLIDSLLLGIFGNLLGLAFFDSFVQLGNWGRLIGFVVAVPYFGLLNSALLGGQTLGKRIMRIKVVSLDGSPLPIAKSLLRAVVLYAPFFVNQLPVTQVGEVNPLMVVISLVLLAGLAIIYLFIFNRPSRRSLHDLVAGSVVIRAIPDAAPVLRPVWRGHLVVVSGITMVMLVGGVVATVLFSGTLNWLSDVGRTVAQLPGIENVRSVAIATNFTSRGTQFTSVRIIVNTKIKTGRQELDKQIALAALETAPAIEQYDRLEIDTLYGYDIGIASAWTATIRSFPPAQWKVE